MPTSKLFVTGILTIFSIIYSSYALPDVQQPIGYTSCSSELQDVHDCRLHTLMLVWIVLCFYSLIEANKTNICRLQEELTSVRATAATQKEERTAERELCDMYGPGGRLHSFRDIAEVMRHKDRQLQAVRDFYSHNVCPLTTTDSCIACIKGVKVALS